MNQAHVINTWTDATHVVAPLIHVPYGAPRPRTLNPPEGAAIREGEYRPHDVTIADARGLGARVDREGFELRASASAVTDFLNDDQIASIYYPEVSNLIIEATGASRVEIFDATRVSSVPTQAMVHGHRFIRRTTTTRRSPHLRESVICWVTWPKRYSGAVTHLLTSGVRFVGRSCPHHWR